LSEIRTKHSTQSEHHIEIFNVKPLVRKEIARHLKVNMDVRETITEGDDGNKDQCGIFWKE